MILTSNKCISGSMLKLIAVATMLIDHLGVHIVRFTPWGRQTLFELGHHVLTPYTLMRGIGRMAFPIFAFLIVEGFLHTRNRVKYGRNLLLFAFLSEIPWNLVHKNAFFWSQQNVFFTLFLGYLGMLCIEHFQTDSRKMALSLLTLLTCSFVLRADYGCAGFGFILLMYALRENPLLRAIIGSCTLSSTWRAGLAFIPITLYNGQRGFVKGNLLKYAFYLFYPLHLFALYLLKVYLLSQGN